MKHNDQNAEREWDAKMDANDRKQATIERHTISIIEDNYLDFELMDEGVCTNEELFKALRDQAVRKLEGKPLNLSLFHDMLDAMAKYAEEIAEREYNGEE